MKKEEEKQLITLETLSIGNESLKIFYKDENDFEDYADYEDYEYEKEEENRQDFFINHEELFNTKNLKPEKILSTCINNWYVNIINNLNEKLYKKLISQLADIEKKYKDKDYLFSIECEYISDYANLYILVQRYETDEEFDKRILKEKLKEEKKKKAIEKRKVSAAKRDIEKDKKILEKILKKRPELKNELK